MDSELNQYITFLNNTLGIQSIVLSSAEIASTTNIVSKKYLIHVENLSDFTSSELELLNKMVSALKLDPNELEVKALDDSNLNTTALFQIILKDQPERKGETYSPRILLNQPELKRKAWDDLKSAFQI